MTNHALYYQNPHPDFWEALIKSGMHGFAPEEGFFLIEGKYEESKFREAFTQVWSNSMYSVEEVLAIIKYTQSEPGMLMEE